MQYDFGTGQVFGSRTDTANLQPIQFGVLQDIDVSFDATVKPLLGQNQIAVAMARGEIKISGKAKFARMSAASYNNLFFGQTAGTGTNLTPLAPGESITVPATPGPYTVTVSHSATYVADLGVFKKTDGTQLTPVTAGAEVAGVSYSVNTTTGVYTFAAGDQTVQYYVSYQYTATGGSKITINNLLMGSTPTFSIKMFKSFPILGTAKTSTLILNACTSKKLSLPYKNQDWLINEFDFEAFADASGVIGTFDMTDA